MEIKLKNQLIIRALPKIIFILPELSQGLSFDTLSNMPIIKN